MHPQQQLAAAPFLQPDQVTEAQLQKRVIELAARRGWLVHHVRPARTKDGSWRTPLQGNKGFPDLTLARDGDVVFAELKSARGRLTAEQEEWLRRLDGAGSWAYVWRPADWPVIVAVLW